MALFPPAALLRSRSFLLTAMVAFAYKLRSPDAGLLPTKCPISPVDWRPRSSHAMLTKRYSRVILAVLLCGAVLVFLSGQDYISAEARQQQLLEAQLAELSEGDQLADVPLYPKFHEYERHLPQHNPALPPPDGEHAKFLFIANHAWSAYLICGGGAQRC